MSNQDFQVTLLSNVPGIKNSPASFATQLARPLDLPGIWEVALIDVTFTHDWFNLHEDYKFAIAIPNTSDSYRGTDESDVVRNQPRDILRLGGPINMFDESQPTSDTSISHAVKEINMISQDFLRKWAFKCFEIKTAEFKDPRDLVEKVGNAIVELFRVLRPTEGGYIEAKHFATYDIHRHRVSLISDNLKFMVIAPVKSSIIHVLGFGKQARQFTTSRGIEFEYLFVPRTDTIIELEAVTTLKTRSIPSLYAYSDIVEPSLVGNTYGSILGYFPVQSSFGDQGYWNFNPPFYVRLKSSRVDTIQIDLRQDNGEPMPGTEGKTTCRLHFRRVR